MTGALKRIFESRIELIQGFDGIIVEPKTIIACYGPKKYDSKAYAKKAKEDYSECLKH